MPILSSQRKIGKRIRTRAKVQDAFTLGKAKTTLEKRMEKRVTMKIIVGEKTITNKKGG